jgi:hypothetical protein
MWITIDVSDVVTTGCHRCGERTAECWYEQDGERYRVVWCCRDCRRFAIAARRTGA